MSLKTLLNIVLLFVGVFFLLIASSLNVTTCVTGTGIESQCNTSMVLVIGAVIFGILGLATTVRSAVALWPTRESS
jgi:hypothetical protein